MSFLKAQPATLPFQQGEKLTMIRKVYQQAVVLPLTQVDTLWKEYEAWETSNNRDLAKEIISKLIQKHQTAKQVRRDRRKFQDYLLKHLVSRPLHCIGAYEGARIKRQLLLWKQLLEYEMTNPLRLEPEALKKRVSFNFRQCISCLLHCPEVWYEYAMFYLSQKSAVDARRVLREGMDFLHQSILMHLIFATFEESMKNFKDAKKIYELCISRNPHPLMFIQYMRFCRRIEGIAAARKAFIAAAKREDCDHRVFVAAALMELRLNKEPQIASRIFNNGLKKFSKNADFMMEYIKFLHQINDHNNMRVVIEQALNELPKEESHEVWKTLLALQYETADLSGIEEIERRYSSFFGIKEGSFNLISRRFSFESLIPEEISALGTSDDLHSNIEMKLPPSPIRGRSFVPPNRARMLKFNPMGMGPDNGMVVNRDEGKFFLPRVPIGPLIVNLLNQLPPRMEFWNQAVDSEQLMRLIASLRMDELMHMVHSKARATPSGMMEYNESMDMDEDLGDRSVVKKARTAFPLGDPHRPPPNDIYRKRQVKKSSRA